MFDIVIWLLEDLLILPIGRRWHLLFRSRLLAFVFCVFGVRRG
jgi:hypothetical protein